LVKTGVLPTKVQAVVSEKATDEKGSTPASPIPAEGSAEPAKPAEKPSTEKAPESSGEDEMPSKGDK